MRFKTELLSAIRDGRKTVTRRLARTEKCPYKIGKIYSATNRPRWTASGTKSNASGGWYSLPIKIVSVREECLGRITEEEAVKEGLESVGSISARDEFLITWGSIHGYDGGFNPVVWRIEFQRVPESWK